MIYPLGLSQLRGERELLGACLDYEHALRIAVRVIEPLWQTTPDWQRWHKDPEAEQRRLRNLNKAYERARGLPPSGERHVGPPPQNAPQFFRSRDWRIHERLFRVLVGMYDEGLLYGLSEPRRTLLAAMNRSGWPNTDWEPWRRGLWLYEALEPSSWCVLPEYIEQLCAELAFGPNPYRKDHPANARR